MLKGKILLIVMMIKIALFISCDDNVTNEYTDESYDEIVTNKDLCKKLLIMPNTDTVISTYFHLESGKQYRVKVFQPDYQYNDYFINTFIVLNENDTIYNPSRTPFKVENDSAFFFGFNVRNDYKNFPGDVRFSVNVFEYFDFPDSLKGIWVEVKEEYKYKEIQFEYTYPESKDGSVYEFNGDNYTFYKKDSYEVSGYSKKDCIYYEQDFSFKNIRVFEKGERIQFYDTCKQGCEKYNLKRFRGDLETFKWNKDTLFNENGKLNGNWYLCRNIDTRVENMLEDEYVFDGWEGDTIYNSYLFSPVLFQIKDDILIRVESDSYEDIDTTILPSSFGKPYLSSYVYQNGKLVTYYAAVGINYNVIDAGIHILEYKKYEGAFPFFN